MLFPKHIFKQYGLPRTGTNYIKALIEKNYYAKVLANIGGWKHGYYCLSKQLDCIVSIKHPLSWLVSMYNHIKSSSKHFSINHVQETFSKFIISPFTIYRNQPLVDNPVKFWNEMYRHWLNIPRVFVIVYENVLINPYILDQLPVSRLKSPLEDIHQVLKPGHEKVYISNDKFDDSYYLEKKYLLNYTSDELDFVISNVDMDIFGRYYS